MVVGNSRMCSPEQYFIVSSFLKLWDFVKTSINTEIPRLTKIIRSGITFVSRNVLSGVSLLAVSNVNNPVGLVGLPCVMWSAHFFVTHTTLIHGHTHTDGKDKLLEWPDRSCLLLYVSARIHYNIR